MGSPFWIDARRCFVNDQLNPNHLLEIFGKLSDQDPVVLRQSVLDIVEQDRDMWENIGRVVLSMKFMNLDTWMESMRDTRFQCDEFKLFVLSRVHCHHSIVYTLK